MSVNVEFFTFSKKENSTARPTVDTGTTFACVLKDGVSILNPVFELQTQADPSALNYAYVPAFNRFYFVNDWTYYRGAWAASLNVDVLASWKTEIGASSQYVARSASAADGSIVDTLYPAKAVTSVASDSESTGWAVEIAGATLPGYYVIGIVNSDNAIDTDGKSLAVGACAYYVFTNKEFRNLVKYLMDTALVSLTTAEKAAINPLQYITTCTWFPFKPPTTGDALTSVNFGWFECQNISCERLASNPVADYGAQWSVTVPKHPQAATRGSYLNTAPYSTYVFDFRPFGVNPIDSAVLIDVDDLYFTVHVDCISGDSLLTLYRDASHSQIINVFPGNVGIPVIVAQLTSDVFGAVGKAVGTVGNVVGNALMGNVAGAIVGGVTGIADAAMSLIPEGQTMGGNGSFVNIAYQPQIRARFLSVVDANVAHFGRPLCKERTISTLSGFILVSDADIALPSTEQEITAIKNYMNGGFFYE